MEALLGEVKSVVQTFVADGELGETLKMAVRQQVAEVLVTEFHDAAVAEATNLVQHQVALLQKDILDKKGFLGDILLPALRNHLEEELFNGFLAPIVLDGLAAVPLPRAVKVLAENVPHLKDVDSLNQRFLLMTEHSRQLAAQCIAHEASVNTRVDEQAADIDSLHKRLTDVEHKVAANETDLRELERSSKTISLELFKTESTLAIDQCIAAHMANVKATITTITSQIDERLATVNAKIEALQGAMCVRYGLSSEA